MYKSDKKNTIQRRIDNQSRVALPVNIRRAYGLAPNSVVDVILLDEGVLIKPHEKSICVSCGSDVDVIMADNTFICRNCLNMLKKTSPAAKKQNKK